MQEFVLLLRKEIFVGNGSNKDKMFDVTVEGSDLDGPCNIIRGANMLAGLECFYNSIYLFEVLKTKLCVTSQHSCLLDLV